MAEGWRGRLVRPIVEPGSVVQKGDVVAVISDPASPGLIVDIVAPEDGLMICTATNPLSPLECLWRISLPSQNTLNC